MNIVDNVKKFTTKKDLTEYLSQDTLECFLCGKSFKALPSHLLHIHDMTPDEYRKEFNIPLTYGLIGESTRKKQSENALNRLGVDGGLISITPELMHRGQTAKKRKAIYYDDHPIKTMAKEKAKNSITKSKAKTLKVIEMMEKEQLPACYICYRSGFFNMRSLHAILRRYEDIRIRYEKAKAAIPKLIELKFGLSTEEIDSIALELRNKGLTYKQIGIEMNLGRSTVIRHLKDDKRTLSEIKLGMPFDEIKTRVFELRNEGTSIQKIASEMKLGTTTVYRILDGTYLEKSNE